MKEIRIYFPVGTQYFMESNWVLLGDLNGERSLRPVAGQPALKYPKVVLDAVQRGEAAIDYEMAIPDMGNGKKQRNAKGGSQSSGAGSRGVERHQIKFTLTDAVDNVGYARLGWTALTGLFDSSIIKGANSVVGGKYTTSVLTYLGYLTGLGTVKITRMKFDGTAGSVFDVVAPTYKRFSAIGTVVQDQIIEYPTASSEDNDTTIRDMDEKWLSDENIEIVLDGRSYLQLAVNKDQTLSADIWFEFTPFA